MTIATFIMASSTGLVFYRELATGFLVLLSVLVVMLVLRTAAAVVRREIRLEGHWPALFSPAISLRGSR